MTEWAKNETGALEATIGEYKFRITSRKGYLGAVVFDVSEPMWGSWQSSSSGKKSLEEAKAWVQEIIEHRREKATLGRRRVHDWNGKRSPWGGIDHAEQYAEGVHSVGTPSHGGFKLSAAMNRQMPAALRSAGGWYEEDCCWARVALGFPHLFTAWERRLAEESLKRWEPDVYEAHFGVTLKPGESHARDEQVFYREHANDWLVTSALNSDTYEGMVEVYAQIGGHRGQGTEARRFLVPKEDYSERRFSFVVDPVRHREFVAA